ncbi:MAG: hypothetical protein VKI82_02710 [Leptolyngbya sp.]|nr:hypothetical protein [Leptolyngbya sp.]
MLPPPPRHPLQRLQVSDGLLVTAERWQVAHQYHRQRQNLHFQAFHQGGVVSGLGVCPTVAPAQVANAYRDGRWLQVQPGVAMDAQGNPIVVPHPVTYRIAAQPTTDPLLVYLVLKFVDPDQLEAREGTHVVQETFRLEEKNSPPGEGEIELCRLVLLPGDAPITLPQNGFNPAANELDWRYRPLAQARPQGLLTLGYLTLTAQTKAALEVALQGLVTALPGLYPTLGGSVHPVPLGLRQGLALTAADIHHYDLLHLTYAEAQGLDEEEIDLLRAYEQGGGTLLVEVPTTETALTEIVQIWADVMKVLSASSTVVDAAMFATLCNEEAELERCLALELAQHLPALAVWARPSPPPAQPDPVNPAAEHPPDWPLAGRLTPHHPLRQQPFTFSQNLVIHQQPLALFNWGGVVVVVGDLTGLWGGPKTQFMPRDSLRNAQELGINLLHLAWQRRQWAMAMVPDTTAAAASVSSLDTIYDRLG